MGSDQRLISAADTAATVQRALDAGDEPAAIRYLTEAVSRLIQAPVGAGIPDVILEPPETIEDVRYGTLIATAFAYAMELRGREPLTWMTEVKPLDAEWLWDGDESSSVEFRELIRRDTPEVFLAKGVLTRPRDWIVV